jgi:integrase/recombinase XerD
MSMRTRVEAYLAMRRSLGYKLHGEGRMLLDFADRLDADGQVTLTVAAAVGWACQPATASAQHHSRRLGVVRGFARHLHALDPASEIPPIDLLPARSHRPAPYLYSAEEVAALVHAAGTLSAPLHAATVQLISAERGRLAAERRTTGARGSRMTVRSSFGVDALVDGLDEGADGDFTVAQYIGA